MRDIQTIIMGNATADPTAHPQEDGSVTAKVRVAVTGRYYNTTSQDFADRKTEFITVSCGVSSPRTCCARCARVSR